MSDNNCNSATIALCAYTLCTVLSDVLLANYSAFHTSTVDKAHAAFRVQATERLNVRCGDVIRSNSELNNTAPSSEVPTNRLLDTQVNFDVDGKEGNIVIKVRA